MKFAGKGRQMFENLQQVHKLLIILASHQFKDKTIHIIHTISNPELTNSESYVASFFLDYFTDPDLKLKIQALIQKKQSAMSKQTSIGQS